MIPGFTATLTPNDIESYNLESPELEAAEVMREGGLVVSDHAPVIVDFNM